MIITTGCSTHAAALTTDITIMGSTTSTETKKEPTGTAVVTKPTQKTNATPTPAVKETTATTTNSAETNAPVATTKATAAPTATSKAPAATTVAPASTTAAPPVETSPPVATTAAYTPNCDNIRSLIVSNLQSRGYWFPDATSIGNDSVGVTTNYFYSDEGFANNIINGKFANLDKLGIGIITVNVVIEDEYLWIYSTKCAYPTA